MSEVRSGCDSPAYGSYINRIYSLLRLEDSHSDKFKSWQFITRVVTAFLYNPVRNLSFVTLRHTGIFIFSLESVSHQESPKQFCALETICCP